MFYNAKMSTKISTSRKKIVLVKKKDRKKIAIFVGKKNAGGGFNFILFINRAELFLFLLFAV